MWEAVWHKTSKTYHIGKWEFFVRFIHLIDYILCKCEISCYIFLVNTRGRERTPAVHLFTCMLLIHHQSVTTIYMLNYMQNPFPKGGSAVHYGSSLLKHTCTMSLRCNAPFIYNAFYTFNVRDTLRQSVISRSLLGLCSTYMVIYHTSLMTAF